MKCLQIFLLLLSSTISHADDNTWPFWRGDASGSGYAISNSAQALPLSWTPGKNIRWRTELPEPGNSTPVTANGRVFVTQPISAENWRGIFCFDAKSGKLIWKNGLIYDKRERTHRTNPYCSASPATDGQHVFASYGSAGIAAYDLDGKQIWHRDLGPITHEFGNSASPLLYGKLCIHYHGPGRGAFLIALDKNTGETVWQWDEPNWQPGVRTDGFRGQGRGIIGSFSTPIILGDAQRPELVMSFPLEMKAFDPRNGKVHWTCTGLNPLVYTSPVAHKGVVVALGGYQGNSIAVRIGGEGDVTSTHRLWQLERHNGEVGTGVIHNDHLYYHDSSGIACCLDVATGEMLWKERLPGNGKSWGSFVLAGDLIYTLSQTGETIVFKANHTHLEAISQASVEEQTNSSLVPGADHFFIRTHKALWCVGSPP
jgi:outer membrane protein assembly factor BamB